MKLSFLSVLCVSLAACALGDMASAAAPAGGAQADFVAFLKAFETKLIPLSRDAALASFNASVSGKTEDYTHSADLQLQLKKLYADKGAFKKLKGWRSSGAIADPLLKRQLEILYLGFLGNQLPGATLSELVRQQTEIEKKFNTFRATLDGKAVTDNVLEDVLGQSTDPARLEQAWKASKAVGVAVAPDVVRLVKLRNKAARELSFANFQQMQLALSEQEPAAIEKLFDELDGMTRKDFAQAKGEIDRFLAGRLRIKAGDLRPWHYQNRFFQAAPKIYPVDLDAYYAGKDVVKTAERYYAGIGLPIDDIVARSDLYEKPGKYQHAFCSDIDRSGDVRILCSIKQNAYWMNTILHEAGHGVYSKFNDPALPWLLRDSAHAFATEAIANLFGRFASHPAWLQDMVGVSAEERAKIADAVVKSLRLEQLVFSRWSQVMFRFEKAMYENPDQNLNKLWWDLVERYQLLARPAGRDEPDWASKIHVALYPAYYHNYLMGELLASQLYHHVGAVVLKAEDAYGQSLVGREEVGRYLAAEVFRTGMSMTWGDMIERATGEKLTPRYYAEQFVGK